MEKTTVLREREEYAFLKRGRKPYAGADLRGTNTDGSCVTGRILFYDTPLGVMISAEVEGLSGSSSVYGFCLCEGEARCRGGKRLCRCMPLIYGKNGRGRGSLVTEWLRREPLIGRRVTLRESVAPDLCAARSVAEGIVESKGFLWIPVGGDEDVGSYSKHVDP